MKPDNHWALIHVLLTACLCIATIHTRLFDNTFTEVGYEYYVQVPIQSFPTFLAMPFNSVINLGCILLRSYWLLKNKKVMGNDEDVRQARYLKDVFASMALLYGTVHWVGIWTQSHRSAVLDQWFTLPILAWPVVWCRFLEDGWQPCLFLCIECISLGSYGLTLFCHFGFDIILACHILAALWSAIYIHRGYGDSVSATYISFALIFCLGFIVLKLADHWLAQWSVFKELTGHFWSKICDITQFHFAFLFLTHFNSPQRHIAEEKNF